MNCELIGIKGTWREIADSARTTVGMPKGDKEPTPLWKRRVLLSEHSIIRKLKVSAKWYELKYWVSVHLVRHKIGVEHWVRTQRDDRTTLVGQTHTSRDDSPQSALIEHEIEANAQAIINISRKRLCNCASGETREAWQAFLDTFKDDEPELYSVCVKECIYRGFCSEFYSCGFHKTDRFKEELDEYRSNLL